MKTKIFIISIIVILTLHITYAQNLCGTGDNPCKDDRKNFDYSNPNADISKIPPDKIDIQRVINNNRGNELTVAQIKANFDRIDDLTKVNLGNARKAILEKYGVTVGDFGQGTSLKGGILRATFGEQEHITVGNEVYKIGFLTINQKGQIIFTPNEKMTQLSISQGDTLTVKTLDSNEKGKYIDIQDYRLKGTFKINEDGTITFLKNEKATINNIEVFSKSHDINLCNINSLCSENYLHLGGRELMAKGTDVTLKFNEYNSYFQLNSGNSEKNLYLPLDRRKDEEKDHFRIILGDEQNYGAISVKIEKNLLPIIQAYGYLKVENDENELEIKDSKLSKILSKKTEDRSIIYYADIRGSVPSTIVVSNDINKVYNFDEDLNILVQSFKDYKLQNQKRLEIADKYNIELSGYFSNIELDTIAKEFELMGNKFEIDFKKFTIANKKLQIREVDIRERGDASVDIAFPNVIKWKPKEDFNSLKEERYLGLFKYITIDERKKLEILEKEILPHEMGHVLSLNLFYPPDELINNLKLKSASDWQRELSKVSEFQREWSNLMQKFNVKFFVESPGAITQVNDASPEYLFPTRYSKYNVLEHQGEIFKNMINNPEWFTDHKITEEQRKGRQAFRDLYLEELKKFKK